MLKLIEYPLCPFSRSIRLALGEYELIVELNEERPFAPSRGFLEINPAGELPVLIIRDDLALSGAYAISEYLGETNGRKRDNGLGQRQNRLFPGDNTERAEIRRLVDWFHRKCHAEVTDPLLEEKVYQRFRGGRGAPDPELIRAGRENLRYHLSYISYLADSRNWLAGDELSFADLAAAGHLSVLDYLEEVPWESYPAAKDWYARIKSRPSFRPLLADRIPGLAPPAAYADLDF